MHIPHKPIVYPTDEQMRIKAKEVHEWAVDMLRKIDQAHKNTSKSKMRFGATV